MLSYITFFSGLAISTVAIFYSVTGLVSIFPGAIIPIIIMGIVLELSKLVATVWLKKYWTVCPAMIKSYLISAIIILMIITSLGIFGFLSRAHLEHNVGSEQIKDRLQIIDDKISLQQDLINSAKSDLNQLNDAVNQTMQRTTSNRGALTSIKVRQNQQSERQQLLSTIDNAQHNIAKLKEERIPINQEFRKATVEFGPLTYIADMVYTNPQEHLDDTVRYVIILLVIVFDPLAVILLLCSQYSFSVENAVTIPMTLTSLAVTGHQDPEIHKVAQVEENDAEIDNFDALDLGEKEAKARWKAENADDTIKRQNKLFNLGLIDNLPWRK